MSTADEPRPVEVGYWLSSEEHGPRTLVDHAVAAEDHGFRWSMISDHFHPWVPEQGHAPFVWVVIGGIAARTTDLHVATGVTAPVRRMHPVVVAHAAATAAVALEGRFALGLGTGERLNEHVVGGDWPRPGTRRRMLREAVEIIDALFAGDEVNHDGEHFTVEHAQLYSRPATPPDIWIAAGGRRTAELAGEICGGMIGLVPSAPLVAAFRNTARAEHPAVAQLHVCWAPTHEEARRTAHRWWPNAAWPPELTTELARPSQFQALSGLVSEEQVARGVVCGPDPEPYARAVARFAAAGYDRVYVHQAGPDQAGFLRFWCDRVQPHLG
jgi:G6PDH family F420-dependent oxidoreductase